MGNRAYYSSQQQQQRPSSGGAAPPVDPPANTVAPVITTDGTPVTGETVTCDTGTWTNSPTYGYQWKRAGSDIGGATTNSYLLVTADEAVVVTCVVTATNAGGSASQASSNSVTTPVTPPANSVLPLITTDGTPREGETITCSSGTWSGSPTYAYQWKRAGSSIGGATTSSYLLVAADDGVSITCTVTATNAGGATAATSLGVTPASPVVLDTFTGTTGTTLGSHTGETGATWTKHTSYAAGALLLSDANRVRPSDGNTACYYASGTPATAEYDVEADFVFKTTIASSQDGVVGRVATGANTMYYLRYRPAITSWELGKLVTGTSTVLGTPYVDVLVADQVYRIKLQIRNATKKVFIDGVERISHTDDTITAAGFAGIRLSQPTSPGNTAGVHLDNLVVRNA